ncbi:DNA polymerase III subunit delta [Nocardioides flavescens]|uniref:DNA-directed DNA polymerase n=1 Tax=Nocardioides flavescens TaxID=2691959 RepID=A0A6L7F165_9ACTN|nr:DNA polymerase III subunit delta [Nocardioides flavescens]MXG91055.1 DNA polymerase III subunit delta [Nocardioides flavescens]
MDVLGRVTLVTGKEEFLGERTVQAVRAAVRRVDPEAEFSEAQASGLTLATLGELSAPSLFSSVRCVVVRKLEDLPEESVAGLLDYAAAPAEDVALVLVHSGGTKGSGVLTKLRKLSGVDESKSGEVKTWELAGFVAAEVKSHGGRIDKVAAQALVQAVGQDLRALAAASDQLVSDAEGRPITEELVRRYFGGRAEGKSFVIADAAFAGRRQAALEELRWALASGVPSTFVTSAFAGSARGLARYASASRGTGESDLAREVGVPPWKLKELRSQSQAWTEPGLSRAIRAVAQADADIKGAASDAHYTLERLVLTITALREPR